MEQDDGAGIDRGDRLVGQAVAGEGDVDRHLLDRDVAVGQLGRLRRGEVDRAADPVRLHQLDHRGAVGGARADRGEPRFLGGGGGGVADRIAAQLGEGGEVGAGVTRRVGAGEQDRVERVGRRRIPVDRAHREERGDDRLQAARTRAVGGLVGARLRAQDQHGRSHAANLARSGALACASRVRASSAAAAKSPAAQRVSPAWTSRPSGLRISAFSRIASPSSEA